MFFHLGPMDLFKISLPEKIKPGFFPPFTTRASLNATAWHSIDIIQLKGANCQIFLVISVVLKLIHVNTETHTSNVPCTMYSVYYTVSTHTHHTLHVLYKLSLS